jgi:hypothetical protein
MDLIDMLLQTASDPLPVYVGPVVWPGQSEDDAIFVWNNKPEYLYEVYAKEMNRKTETYINALTLCAQHGDWMAHAMFAFHYKILGAEEYVSNLPILRLATVGSICEHTLYAHGAFLYTVGRKADAQDMWFKTMHPRAMFSMSIMNNTHDVGAETDSHPLIEPHRAYVIGDKYALLKMAENDPHAAVFYSLLSSSEDAVTLLKKHAICGAEGAARRLLEIRPRTHSKTLGKMAKAGVQCVYNYALPIRVALEGKRDRMVTDAPGLAADVAKNVYGVSPE